MLVARLVRAWVVVLALIWGLGWTSTVHGQVALDESQVKAAFLYKFGDYVEWPPQAFERPDAPFVIGVVAADATADALTQIAAGHTINGRPVAIRRLQRGESLTGVHIVFIGQVGAARLSEMLAAAKSQSVLTVTDSGPDRSTDSVINFVVVDDKVRFDIALPVAEQSNLKISARLLGVARRVIPRSS